MILSEEGATNDKDHVLSEERANPNDEDHVPSEEGESLNGRIPRDALQSNELANQFVEKLCAA